MAINQGGAMHPQTKPNRQNNKQPNKTDNLPPHYGVQSAGFIVYHNRNEQHLVVKKMVYVFNNVFPRTRDAPFWNDQSLRVFYNIRSSIPLMGGVDNNFTLVEPPEKLLHIIRINRKKFAWQSSRLTINKSSMVYFPKFW